MAKKDIWLEVDLIDCEMEVDSKEVMAVIRGAIDEHYKTTEIHTVSWMGNRRYRDSPGLVRRVDIDVV